MKRDLANKIFEYLKQTRKIIADEIALNYIELYPNWEKHIGEDLSVGDRVEHEGKLYKVVQAHTTQESWKPDLVPSLFEPIDIINEGTLENPIVAAVGMCYLKDKYYLDESDGNIYLCTRADTETGTTLYFLPSALVGNYFERV